MRVQHVRLWSWKKTTFHFIEWEVNDKKLYENELQKENLKMIHLITIEQVGEKASTVSCIQ